MTWHEIAKLFESLELSLIASLHRNLSRHRAEEEKEGFSWPAWQAEKLKSIGAYLRQNKDIMLEYAPTIDDSTAALLEEQFAEGRESVNVEIAALTGAVPQAPEGAFFRTNKRAVNSIIKDTNTSFAKAETASLRMMEDVYRKTVERAALAASTGTVTPRQAIDMATKDFLTAGITCIEYKDGKRINIASYAEMAIRTAAIRSYMRGESARRKELGIDTVLVSQYGACSKTCLPWQGRVYIDDVWTTFDGPIVGDHGLSNSGNWYMLLSVAIKGGLFHPNCRHTVSSWIEGISRLPNPLDRDAVRKNAELEARQRAMERKVRKYKRLAEGSVDPEDRKRYAQKMKDSQAELRQFVKSNSDVLRRDYWREQVSQLEISRKGVILNSTELRYHPITNKSITSVPIIKPASMTSAEAKILRKLHRELLRKAQMLPLGTEVAVAYDETLKPIKEFTGSDSAGTIRISDEKPYLMMHNHPDGQMFSIGDILTFINLNDTKVLTAVGNTGNVYMLEKLSGYDGNGFKSHVMTMVAKHPEMMNDVDSYIRYMRQALLGGESYGVRYVQE